MKISLEVSETVFEQYQQACEIVRKQAPITTTPAKILEARIESDLADDPVKIAKQYVQGVFKQIKIQAADEKKKLI